MKILQINASYKPAFIYGGPTMSVSKLSEELLAFGWQIEVLTTTANGTEELLVKPGEAVYVDGVKATYFKRKTKDHTHYSPDLLLALRQQIQNFDVVHIHAWWNLVSLLACRIAIKRGVPVVVSPRGTLSNYSFKKKNSLAKKLIHALLGKRLLRQSFIHVTSEREKQAIEHLISPKNIFFVPNFIALPETVNGRERVSNSDSLKLIFLSRIDKKKGIELLFDALSDIGLSYSLTIAGSGDEAYVAALKIQAKKNRIAEHIHWVGFRTDDKFELLFQHDLFILPSYDENFGNAVIESLAVGTAVLISENVGLHDYVDQKKLGWVCAQNTSSLRQHIITIAAHRDELQRIREEAPEITRQDFNEQALTKKYVEMYKEVIANG